MVFHRSRIRPNVINKVVIDNHELTQVNSAKYLAVIIDHKLIWIELISYVKSKMGKGIGIMYKARQILLMLYHAYIFPYMTYCIEIWGCASQIQLNCLLLLQKKIIRIMSFSHYLAHTNPLFLSMGVLHSRIPNSKSSYRVNILVRYMYISPIIIVSHSNPRCIFFSQCVFFVYSP